WLGTSRRTPCRRISHQTGLLCQRQLDSYSTGVWQLQHARAECVQKHALLQLGSFSDESDEIEGTDHSSVPGRVLQRPESPEHFESLWGTWWRPRFYGSFSGRGRQFRLPATNPGFERLEPGFGIGWPRGDPVGFEDNFLMVAIDDVRGKKCLQRNECIVAAVYDRRYFVDPGKTGAHRAPLQSL